MFLSKGALPTTSEPPDSASEPSDFCLFTSLTQRQEFGSNGHEVVVEPLGHCLFLGKVRL